MIKKITCIGAGFVGGPSMSIIALMCPEIEVTLVDTNEDKIDAWNGDLNKLPVFEPGLSDIIKKVRGKNLFFSKNIDESIEKSDMIFMAVNTPTKKTGKGKGYAADLRFVESSAIQIAKASKSNKIIVEKSTLPVRTAEKIKHILDSNKSNGVEFEILSNPEFLAEGTAIQDLYKSDRVLIGGEETENGKKAVKLLFDIYARWIPEEKILTTNIWSSELSKLVSNAMLAQRISSINSISAICEKTGAKIQDVAKAVGMDTRIGSKFLNASVGFGGSCFKKDILNLVYIARYYNLNEVANYWESVVKINNYQTRRIAEEVFEILNPGERNVTIFGWSFKKDTNDSRESASIYLSKKLLDEGFKLNIYDPKVPDETIIKDLKDLYQSDEINNQELINNISVYDNPYHSVINSNLIIICTEWDEFKNYRWDKIFDDMNRPQWIFDTRNILNETLIEKIGFKTFFIGQQFKKKV